MTPLSSSPAAGARLLPVNWFDLAWQPRLKLRRARQSCPPSRGPGRRFISKSNPMKTSLVRSSRRPAGFTLIELLVVIAIIGILAGLLLPALSAAKYAALKKRALTEMNGLAAGINQYESQYGRFPASSQAVSSLTAATTGGCPDFTFGTVITAGVTPMPTSNPYAKAAGGLPLIKNIGNTGGTGPSVNYQANNSEVMAILMDQVASPDGSQTVNAGHAKNPQQNKFFEGHPAVNNTGVGDDDVYRDPWGDPYIITLDLNGDNRCRDAFYRNRLVSQKNAGSPLGLVGLNNAVDLTLTGSSDDYEVPVTVMIWSLGRDGQASSTGPNAISGVNKDNLLNWQ